MIFTTIWKTEVSKPTAKLLRSKANSSPDQAIRSEDIMPSPTEDREIEELLSYLEADEARATGGRQSNRSVTDSAYCDSAVDTISDDEDYDRLFMEVMADDGGTLQAGMSEGRVWCEADQTQESCMDLS
jgi:hypothetical protein